MTTDHVLTQPGTVIRSRLTGRVYTVLPDATPGYRILKHESGERLRALATDLTNGSYDLVTASQCGTFSDSPLCGFRIKENPLLPPDVIAVQSKIHHSGLLATMAQMYRMAADLGPAEHEPSSIPEEVIKAAEMQSYPNDREQIAAALGMDKDATTEAMVKRIQALVHSNNAKARRLSRISTMANEIVAEGSLP